MAPVRSTTVQRRRRHAARPRPWAQFPWTILGMAFITALLLASYQTAGTVSGSTTNNPVVQFDRPNP